jgi:hypothetical protein
MSPDNRRGDDHRTCSAKIADSCAAAECRYSITSWALESYSGNPAFRRPSINSFAFDCPPRAIYEDIAKPGSVSSRCAAASRASASRPRWANADTNCPLGQDGFPFGNRFGRIEPMAKIANTFPASGP